MGSTVFESGIHTRARIIPRASEITIGFRSLHVEHGVPPCIRVMVGRQFCLILEEGYGIFAIDLGNW